MRCSIPIFDMHNQRLRSIIQRQPCICSSIFHTHIYPTTNANRNSPTKTTDISQTNDNTDFSMLPENSLVNKWNPGRNCFSIRAKSENINERAYFYTTPKVEHFWQTIRKCELQLSKFDNNGGKWLNNITCG